MTCRHCTRPIRLAGASYVHDRNGLARCGHTLTGQPMTTFAEPATSEDSTEGGHKWTHDGDRSHPDSKRHADLAERYTEVEGGSLPATNPNRPLSPAFPRRCDVCSAPIRKGESTSWEDEDGSTGCQGAEYDDMVDHMFSEPAPLFTVTLRGEPIGEPLPWDDVLPSLARTLAEHGYTHVKASEWFRGVEVSGPRAVLGWPDATFYGTVGIAPAPAPEPACGYNGCELHPGHLGAHEDGTWPGERTLSQGSDLRNNAAHRMGYRDGWYGLADWSSLVMADARDSYRQGRADGATDKAALADYRY